MGLFDELAGGIKHLISKEGEETELLNAIGDLINDPQTGGITGFVQTMKDKGLGDVVSSWISTGPNPPISADQIKTIIDAPHIQQIGQKLGLTSEEVSEHLAEYLPRIIDKLTPNGTLPVSGDEFEKGLGALKGKLFGD